MPANLSRLRALSGIAGQGGANNPFGWRRSARPSRRIGRSAASLARFRPQGQ